MKLDEVDYAILRVLQLQARLKNKELARRIGLSPSACLERVKRLEGSGVITGYRAVVAPQAVGAYFEAWVEIALKDHSLEAVGRFSKLVQEAPAIVSAYRLAGPYDFLVHLVADTIDAWKTFLARALDQEVAIGETRLAVVIDRAKDEAPLALPAEPTKSRRAA